MKTFAYIIMLMLAVFASACSSKATVTGSKPVVPAQAEKNPSERSNQPETRNNPGAQTDEEQNQNDAQADRTDRDSETNRGAETDNGAETDTWPQDNRGAADDLGTRTDDRDNSDSRDAGNSNEMNASDQNASQADAGRTDADAEREYGPDGGVSDGGVSDGGIAQSDAGNLPPADPHVFATEELGVLVRTEENTEVKPAEKPFWADDALATSAFERESGKQYSVLVYEKRPDELFEDWLMRSKVGGTTVSQRRVRTENGRWAYVYATDDYGAVPNVHIIVPTERFVYYFRSEEDTFDVPDDFVNFIREIEVE